MATIPGFFGREAELAWLLRLWNDTAIRDEKGARAGPRMAILIAETGLGKSRLVQALYQLLTNDPFWNPSDKSYWPNNIVSNTGQIHLNPQFDNYDPSGPPKFLWLGEKWQETAARNPEERRCKIPALRDMLAVHVRIAERKRTVWQRLRSSAEKKIRDEGPGYLFDKAIDLSGIPYAGLVYKLYKAGASARNAPTTVSEAVQTQLEDASEIFLAEMREVFGGLGGGGLVLPTILWLDDAHWIDAMTLRFLHKLWKEATEKRWPLLIIITHWEREWNKLQSEPAGKSLLDLAAEPGVEKWILTKAPVSDVEARLNERLPGLLPAQRASMLEKAAGNFLTLEENVGYLIGNPAYFVDFRVGGPLNDAGEKRVATWASNRQRQIEDRFMAMEPNPSVQQLLAWSSRVGINFPHEVAIDFAGKRQAGNPDSRQLLENCVAPYAVLGKPSPNFLEFRDHAYYSEGIDYFKMHLAQKDETELLATLRDNLAKWINGAFDENGTLGLTENHKTPVSGQNMDQFSSFTKDERRTVLEIALRELPLPLIPDWTHAHHRAALRSILIYLDSAGRDSLWPAVSQCAPRLRGMHWEDIPAGVASTEFLLGIGVWLNWAGMTDIAAPLIEWVLVRRTQNEQQDSDWAEKMIRTLNLLGNVYVKKGSFEAAEEVKLRSLRLAEKTFGPDHLKVAVTLVGRGGMFIDIRRYEEAEVDLQRAKVIFERVLREEASADDTRLLTSMQFLEGILGNLYLRTGRAARAEAHFRVLVGMENRLDPQAFAVSLNYLGEAVSAQGGWEEAEPMRRRAIAILERTLGAGHPDVALAKKGLAIQILNHEGTKLVQDQARTTEAIALMTSCYEILEQAYGPTHFEVAKVLSTLAEVYWSQGNESRAAPFARRAVEIMEEKFGPDHPMVGEILCSQADALRAYDQPKAAEPLFLKGIGMMKRSPDLMQKPLGRAYYNLGLLRKSEGHLTQADAYCERAVAFLEKGLGPTHPEVAQVLETRAVLYRAMGNNDKAEAALKRAQEIRQALKDRSSVPLSAPVTE